jgi:cbb3-type cytochrome oxidase maturation protein
MTAIYVLLPLSLLVALGFLAAFIWAVRSGQYEDTCTPAMRMLLDDPAQPGRAGTNNPEREEKRKEDKHQ